jgi:putative oxidoreductase
MFQRQAFFKNLGIAGGLLLLAALGPGPLTIEKEKT